MTNPLDKQKFLGGNRQKWMLMFMVYSLILAFLQIKFHLDISSHMNFIMATGSLLMIGSSVDSTLKITKAKNE